MPGLGRGATPAPRAPTRRTQYATATTLRHPCDRTHTHGRRNAEARQCRCDSAQRSRRTHPRLVQRTIGRARPTRSMVYTASSVHRLPPWVALPDAGAQTKPTTSTVGTPGRPPHCDHPHPASPARPHRTPACVGPLKPLYSGLPRTNICTTRRDNWSTNVSTPTRGSTQSGGPPTCIPLRRHTARCCGAHMVHA